MISPFLVVRDQSATTYLWPTVFSRRIARPFTLPLKWALPVR